MNKIVIEPELLESLYWGNRYEVMRIAGIFGCCDMTVWKRIREYGIPCRTASHIVTDFIFNDRQREIFEGCMIGDGGLVWATNYCYFSNTDIHEEYLIWLQRQLGVEDISKVEPHYVNGYAYTHRLRTSVIPSIGEEYKRWYPYETRHGTNQNRNNKIIPKDIELTLINVLFWYIGDGHYYNGDNAMYFDNSLSLEDAEILRSKLCVLLNVDNGITINKHSHQDSRSNQVYGIRLNEIVTSMFFDMVDSLGFDIPDCYKYKFGR